MTSRYARRSLSWLSACAGGAWLAVSCAGSGGQSGDTFVPADEPAPAASAGAERDAPTAVPAEQLEAPPEAPASAEPLPSEPVYLNGQQLSDADLGELQAVLGRAPAPGRFWYDPRSGLWGLQEHGAGGVTRPGLRVPAPLPADASRGTSGAFINDRQLTARELSTMAQLLGWDAQSLRALTGRYVLDEQGGLYSAQGRYLGNLSTAAARAREQSTSPAPCAWHQLGASPDVLGRTVTINCD